MKKYDHIFGKRQQKGGVSSGREDRHTVLGPQTIEQMFTKHRANATQTQHSHNADATFTLFQYRVLPVSRTKTNMLNQRSKYSRLY